MKAISIMAVAGMADQNKLEQLRKLARTLVASGLAPNIGSAISRAKEILNVSAKLPEEIAGKKEESPGNLPKVDDIEEAKQLYSADVSSGAKDKTLRELMEEDAEKVYGSEKNGSK